MKKRFAHNLVLGVVMLLTACTSTQVSPTPVDQLDLIRTSAASTIQAMTTSIVATDLANQTMTSLAPSLETPTPQPIETTPSMLPVETREATNAPTAVTSEPSGCNLAGFVDETIPDGSQFYPGTAFTKTWTLKNEGTCTWTTGYSVVFISGSAMGAPNNLSISDRAIAPGETVEISIPFTAPNEPGGYKAEFKMRTSEGVIFAFRNPDATFWAQIQVRGDSINLSDSYCSATWTTPTGRLNCPGQPGDSGGFIYSDNRPILEDGSQDNETALWLGLYNADDSYLEGSFPAMTIPANAHFTAILGCKRGNTACDVQFSLQYEDSSGNRYKLAEWHEVHDLQFQKLDVDLGSLGGKQVKIVLVLQANGSPSGDVIHLLKPEIKP
ncbi:MAG: NBR1-Ig-like domain-containing protein [Anaerolineaceae bacterium]